MEKKKKVFYSELAYVFGIIFLALGTAFMERADFGMSMVVAPAYVLHLKISQVLPFFTFGMAEYTFQALVLVLMVIVIRRFRWSYLLSFVTAVVYGFTLDGCIWLVAQIEWEGFAPRIVFYVAGMIVCALGVALFFRSYIPPGAYELFVKEVSARFNRNINRVKTVYDCSSCVLAVVLSFVFFGFGTFEGVKLGTVFCALVNGSLIGLVSKILDRFFEFKKGIDKAK
ncbi:MAG: hypothetical protein ILP10_05350 [Lachnospiraceae bacterium]|nr:hypothetical protein [Lachnospiraceae bacterium]